MNINTLRFSAQIPLKQGCLVKAGQGQANQLNQPAVIVKLTNDDRFILTQEHMAPMIVTAKEDPSIIFGLFDSLPFADVNYLIEKPKHAEEDDAITYNPHNIDLDKLLARWQPAAASPPETHAFTPSPHRQAVTALEALSNPETPASEKAALLQTLQQSSPLKELDLDEARITDAALEHLKHLPNLEEINFEGTSVTDAGLQHLTPLTQLKWLYLSGTNVSDAGLKHLLPLTQLKGLHVGNTRVTTEGCRPVKEAIPDCDIYI